MKMMKPIVSISKIVNNYDTIVIGFRGALFEGLSIKKDAAVALLQLKKMGKKIILLTNSPIRTAKILSFLNDNGLPEVMWDAVVTAGEIIHYKLKTKKGEFSSLGNKFYRLGSKKDNSVFSGLKYEDVLDISQADFLYMSEANGPNDIIENYLPALEYGANQSLPLLCVGNDASNYVEGHISLAPGTVAEQYAVMGGRIITVGKPNPEVLLYSLENFENIEKNRTVMIGDNLAVDIKGANLIGIDSVLISKGIHVNFLGEGYIPDVTKARELATNFEAYPDFIISNLRW